MVLMAKDVYPRVKSSAQISTQRGLQILTFQAMATVCSASFISPNPAATKTFVDELLAWVANFEARYSRFIPDSLIGKINESAGRDWVEIDEECERFFMLCSELTFFTRGAFDPSSLPLIKLWNWKANPPVIPSHAEIEKAKELVGWHKVQRKKGAIFLPKPGMCLDLGGIGKEYAVDRAVQLAEECGLQNVLIDFGRDVKAIGHPMQTPAWHVGLEDANNPGKCWAGVAISGKAVATSGDYCRKFEINGKRYGHILDPRSGYPVDNDCRSVSVIAPTCTIAGILSTTAFVLGAKDGLALIRAYFGAEGAITTNNNRFHTMRFHEYVVS